MNVPVTRAPGSMNSRAGSPIMRHDASGAALWRPAVISAKSHSMASLFFIKMSYTQFITGKSLVMSTSTGVACVPVDIFPISMPLCIRRASVCGIALSSAMRALVGNMLAFIVSTRPEVLAGGNFSWR